MSLCMCRARVFIEISLMEVSEVGNCFIELQMRKFV